MMHFFSTDRNKAILALIIVAAGYSLLSVAVRLLNEAFQPLTQIYVRVSIAVVISIGVFHRHIHWHKFLHLVRKDVIGLLMMGVLGYGLTVYGLTLGALHTSLVNVSVIYATLPFFAFIGSVVLLRNSIKWSMIILLLISFLGVGMIATKSYVPVIAHLGFGEGVVLLAAALGSFYSIGRKLLSDHLNNAEISIAVMLIAALVTFVAAMIQGEKLVLSNVNNWHVILGLAIGAGFNIVATFFENFAFKRIDIVLGNQFLLTESLFALALGSIFYHERVLPVEVIGAILILASVIISNQRLASSKGT